MELIRKNRIAAKTARKKPLVAVAIVAILTTASGAMGSKWVRSSGEIAAETAPPPPSILTADVEERVLKDTVLLRGTVMAREVIEVSPADSAAVITGVRKRVNDPVKPGEVIAEVSGRPIFALAGKIPMYRDLRPGAGGSDVAQLQAALKKLGYDVRDRTGYFGSNTRRAVERLYLSMGYSASTTGNELEVDTARRALRSADRAVEDAAEALKSGAPSGKETPPSAHEAGRVLARAKEDRAEARAAFAALETRSGAMVPLTEMVFLPSFPARVSMLGSVGNRITEPPILALSCGDLVVTARLKPGERDLLDVGMSVEIHSEIENFTAQGAVTAIGGLEADAEGVRAHPVIVAAKKPMPPALQAEDVRLTVHAASTAGSVLVVPLIAVSAGADGRTRVIKLTAAGEERVEVRVGVSGDGFVQVEPVESGNLVARDRVVVGR
ncbi:peptidoglycan-binding domain-containing protein [Micromonospora sp. BQ11]|uniref:peptidoglycan-binding domain-containing protein n=1 Tax=Micromonospora sp. BQ11 TaxID=3452212 RepID=UPI003F887CEF